MALTDRKLVNGEMIVLGRQYRGMTARDLADAMGVSNSLLSMMERGTRTASDETIASLSRVLRLNSTFFTRTDRVYPSNLHWRKSAKAGPRYVAAAEAEMNVHRLTAEQLLRSIQVTAKPLPSIDVEEHDSAAAIARTLRQLWKVSKGPILALYELIERNGVLVCLCDFESPDIDGRSMYTKDKQPILFVNRNSPMDRQRLTVAHELGHLVMHTNYPVSRDRDVEAEAMEFASEFLMPSAELRPQLSGPIKVELLADLKRYWRVSMQAILYRTRTERLITDTNWRRMWMEFNRLGIKRREPLELDPPMEKPVLLKRLVQMHQEELEMSLEEIAELCGVLTAELQEKYVEQGNRKQHLFLS